MRILLSALCLAISTLSFAQISGNWQGDLAFQGQQIPLVFHIVQDGSGYSATLDSPEQNAKGIAVSTVDYKGGRLSMEISAMRAKYVGTLAGDKITGTFEQAGLKFPLNLERVAKYQKKVVERPQDPKPPFPYAIQEVTFMNDTANIQLAGTLTIPENCDGCPAVVLISGSGPQDRNSEIMDHRPFWVLADYLSKSNIAVLRFDDRGVGESEGQFKYATTEDFATDAAAALDFLKTFPAIDSNNLGLIGHSEGGYVATMLAANREDVAFTVLLASPGVPGAQILLEQQMAAAENASLNPKQEKDLKSYYKGRMNIVLKTQSKQETKTQLEQYAKKNFKKLPPATRQMGVEKYSEAEVAAFTDPWLKKFVSYDPRTDLASITKPILAINGRLDTQVPSMQNLVSIKTVTENAGNAKVDTVSYEGLNHLFQPAETGAVMEYRMIDTTFDLKVMQKIGTWINQTTGAL